MIFLVDGNESVIIKLPPRGMGGEEGEREEMKNTTANNNTISLHYFVVKIHTIDSH